MAARILHALELSGQLGRTSLLIPQREYLVGPAGGFRVL